MPVLHLIFIAALSFSCFACAGQDGPFLACPAVISIGIETAIEATDVDDALIWTLGEGDSTGSVFVLPDGTEAFEITTSVIGDPGPAKGVTRAMIRAASVGTLELKVQETVIGPGIGLPRLLGVDTCFIEVTNSQN